MPCVAARAKRLKNIPTPSDPTTIPASTGIVVVLLVALVFHPLLFGGFGFVNLDDATAIYENPRFRGLSLAHLEWMFTTPHMGHYQPLTWLSLGLDFTLFGMDPAGYHRTNLLLHLANAFFVYLLFALLLRRACPRASENTIQLAAAVGAMFFAVHPLRVESVAWVTERRDVLSGLFYLLALIFYLRHDERPGAHAPYLLCFLFFVLSMLAKAWGVTIVAVLLLLDAWPLRRFGSTGLQRILWEKVPFLVCSIVCAILASWAQSAAGAMKSFADHGWTQRMAQAAYGLCFYPVATVWPFDLHPMHELEADLDPFRLLHILCFVTVAAVSAALIVWRRRVPFLTVSWFTYACIVAPVLGFAQSGPQKVADRYTYLPCLPFALLVAGMTVWSTPRCRRKGPLVAATVVLILAVLTHQQLGIWRNSVALWEHTVRLEPHGHFALFNLAKAYEDEKRFDDSIRCLRLALKARPTATTPRRNLGILLATQKRDYDAAIEEFAVLLRQNPADAEAHYCIGLCHDRRNRTEAALRSFLAAVRHHPDYAPAHRALGDTYQRLGDYRKAAEHRRLAGRLERGRARR